MGNLDLLCTADVQDCLLNKRSPLSHLLLRRWSGFSQINRCFGIVLNHPFQNSCGLTHSVDGSNKIADTQQMSDILSGVIPLLMFCTSQMTATHTGCLSMRKSR